MELGFVQFLTSAGDREGKSIIEFDESVWCDAGTCGFLSQNALWTGYREFLDNLRHTAKRKTKVPLPVFRKGWEDSQEAPSVRVG